MVFWDWVDESIEKRAWFIAHIAPRTMSLDQWKDSLAREVLVRYGKRNDVRKELRANYSTEGWSGSESTFYEGKKQILTQFRDGETNANVKTWLDEYILSMEAEIKREDRRGTRVALAHTRLAGFQERRRVRLDE